VTITRVPFSVMQEALAAGKIDLGMFPQPYAALVEKQMKVRKLSTRNTGCRSTRNSTSWRKRRIPHEERGAIRRFARRPLGVDAILSREPRAARQAADRGEIRPVDPEVYMTMQTTIAIDLRVDADALEKMQAFQIKPGSSKSAPTCARWSTLGYCRMSGGEEYSVWSAADEGRSSSISAWERDMSDSSAHVR